ncbi:monooxygenase [Thalassobacillus devorans]|uniref:Monooxygenase n=1 Tax=Thalassobacillus devorans TaxID=279813 RepID=A0ABQ1P3B5_9BACI|nr:AbrB family transcriptional regulator [Thalassobacillus devorans]NIK28184.1 hypothetical protein [Thalassobacillus devorans]GGC88233.1 monooxygenase [Thalassobacillus devorans]
MFKSHLWKLLLSFLISIAGGGIFLYLHFPLPWILGPVAFLLIYKVTTKKATAASLKLWNLSFGFLGIQIGNTFTADTFSSVAPYLIPYSIFTFLLIAISLLNAYVISRYIEIDAKTSMLGSVPGGLSAMLALSDSLRGNTVLVTILHTIRLVTVLFAIPFMATHFFASDKTQGAASASSHVQGEWYTILFYIAAFLLGFLLQKRIPASLVIVPMLITGGIQSLGMPLFELPGVIFIFAQLSLGVYLGNSVSITDVIRAGRYCFYYFGLALFVILVSFGLGYLLTQWTGMELSTAILSIAPGGLIEMALTADAAGGDPSIVSSLQMIRLLMIVLLLPFLLQWLLPKLEGKETSASRS